MSIAEAVRHLLALAPVPAIFLYLLSRNLPPAPAIGRALLIWAGLAFAIAELLGHFGLLGFPALALFWMIVSSLFAGLSLRQPRPAFRRPSALGLTVALYAAVILAAALLYPPNNFDSQTYHLPRIEHWLQDGSLTPYPTANDRQIGSAPLAEILVLQFRALAGDDAFSALVQWLALLGAAGTASEIARRLGAGSAGQALSALFAVTIPMAVLQGSSTQTDLVAGFFALLFVDAVLAYAETGRQRDLATSILAISLGFLAKVTALLFALGFGLWLLWSLAAKRRAHLWEALIGGIAVFTAVNILFLGRNLASFGALSPESGRLGSGSFGPLQTLNTSILDLGANLATGLPAVDLTLASWIRGFCDLVGVSQYRADTQIDGAAFALPIGRQVFHEDYAANLVPLILIAVSAAFLLWRRPRERRLTVYLAALAVGFLAFASTIRWQPWVTRLELPFFLLAAPFVGSMLARTRRRIAIAGLLVAGSLAPLLFDPIRPILPPKALFEPRLHKLFADSRRLEAPYEAAAGYIRSAGVRNLGLLLARDDWEYPLWVLLRPEIAAGGIRIEHVVQDRTDVKTYPLGPFTPDLVLLKAPDLPEQLDLAGGSWHRVFVQPPLALYAPP